MRSMLVAFRQPRSGAKKEAARQMQHRGWRAALDGNGEILPHFFPALVARTTHAPLKRARRYYANGLYRRSVGF
jgi:hypothetical protein